MEGHANQPYFGGSYERRGSGSVGDGGQIETDHQTRISKTCGQAVGSTFGRLMKQEMPNAKE